MTEAQLQDGILDCARSLGWLPYHTHDSRRSHKGFPDLVLAKGRRLIFAELKNATRPLTAEQQEWMVALKPMTCHEIGDVVETYVWRPDDWTTGRIERILRGADRPAA